MAHNHDLTRRVWAIARKANDGLYCARAANVGPLGQHDSARPGSVMAIQRFGGALNLNVHFHALYTDGSFYERSDGQVVFLQTGPPTVAGLEVPSPRVNTLLYGGLFAANARLRREVVAYRRPGAAVRKRPRAQDPSKPCNTAWAELTRPSR